MKIVRVTYTAKPEFTEQNKQNIQRVMADLRALGNRGINYHVCLGPDGKTFTHTTFFTSESEQYILDALPSFKNFQERLKEAGFEVPPKQELLSFVGSSVDVLPE